MMQLNYGAQRTPLPFYFPSSSNYVASMTAPVVPTYFGVLVSKATYSIGLKYPFTPLKTTFSAKTLLVSIVRQFYL